MGVQELPCLGTKGWFDWLQNHCWPIGQKLETATLSTLAVGALALAVVAVAATTLHHAIIRAIIRRPPMHLTRRCYTSDTMLVSL